MAARDRRRLEPGDPFVQPSQEVLALTERDLAIVQEEAKTDDARVVGPTASATSVASPQKA